MSGIDFTSYQQPGVYVSETQGPQASARLGEGVVLGLVGQTQGFRTITEQTALSGTDPYWLGNLGVLSSGLRVVGRANGVVYVNEQDYQVVIDAEDGETQVMRVLTDLTQGLVSVSESSMIVSHDTDASLGLPDGRYVREGTVVVTNDAGTVTYDEGDDYEVDYFNGIIKFLSTGDIADEAEVLVSLDHCSAEPMVFSGVAANVFGNPAFVEQGTVTVESADGMTEYDEGVDFVVDYDSGTIVRLLAGSLGEGTIVYVAYSYCRIKSDSFVSITYRYADSTFFESLRFTDYDEVVDAYGNPFNSDGTINSSLTLLAFFAFRNGANVVYGSSVEDNSASSYQAAVNRFNVVDEIDIICVDSGNATIHDYVMQHVAAMVENQVERRAIFGADGSSLPITSTNMIARAQSLANERAMFVSPSSIQYFNPVTNVVQVLPGYYVAAAVAGMNVRYAPYESLTMKQVTGFYNINETRSKANKLNEMRNGLAYVETHMGQLRVIHGKSTNTDTVERAEWSVSFAKDRIAKALRDAFGGNIVGQPITAETPMLVKSMTIGVLEGLLMNGYMAEYANVKSRQNQNDPTLMEVKFEYMPTYPTNYVYIQFSIDTKSGAVEEV